MTSPRDVDKTTSLLSMLPSSLDISADDRHNISQDWLAQNLAGRLHPRASHNSFALLRYVLRGVNGIDDTHYASLAYQSSMAPRQLFPYTSNFDATSLPSSQNRQTSSQHASDGPDRRGDRTEHIPQYPDTDTGYSSDFQGWQSQSSAFSSWPNQQAEGQWGQQWQQQQQSWRPINSAYTSTAAFSQNVFPNNFSTEQQTWQQQYPQYGHINPAFFPQQSVANAQHTANNTSGYGGVNPSTGTTYNARQQRGHYEPNGWTYQIPMANGQAQATAYQQHNYSAHQHENAISQSRYQAEPTSNYSGGYATAATANFPKTERYDNRFPQIEALMNPLYMRSPQLTPPGENPRLYALPHPKPSRSYLERANLPPRRLSSPRKLLIVLDLNGTLLLRVGRGSNYTPRPHVPEFLAYCLEHHALIIWSSARPHNVTAMVAQLFTPEQHAKLVKIWSRDHLRLGVHFNAKVQVYKQLPWLWEDAEVQTSFPDPADKPFKVQDGWKEPPPTKWDQSNTVLLDDSVDKAASEPYNLVQVDEFTKETRLDGDDVLGRVVAYLEDLKWEADVSAAMRVRPFVNGKGEGWDWGKGEKMATS
jgi:hypothetical protein